MNVTPSASVAALKSSYTLITGPLTIAATGNFNVTPPTLANPGGQRTVLVAASLSNSGRIDLSNNDMIDQTSSDAPAVISQLKAGFNAGVGYWNGTSGIVSTSAANDSTFLTTLGYRIADGATMFDGQTPNSGSIEVKYTYYGDADLNGTVNGADYTQIDLGFGGHLTGWSNGDFNYDGVVNGLDYALIDNTFNQLGATGAGPLALIGGSSDLLASSSNLIASPAASAVPEPTTLGLLGIGAMGLLGRRRRRTV